MKLLYYIWFFIGLLPGCEKNTVSNLTARCDQIAVVDENLFENGPSDYVNIVESEIEGDCLRIKFGASGCDGKSWNVRLIGSEYLVETLIPVRYIRLSMDNKEDCLAALGKEMTFDIQNFRSGGDAVILKFLDSDVSIRYNY